MKRFWLGLAILVGLMALGIAVTVMVDRFCAPISRELDRACLAVQQGKWDQAEQLSGWAKKRWEKHRALHAAVTNHEPMEQIDALFDQLEIYKQARDSLRFAECCARLVSLTDAVAEFQAIYWWNLL